MGRSRSQKRVGGKIDCAKVYLDHAASPRKLSTRIAKFFCDRMETQRGELTAKERQKRIDKSVQARQDWKRVGLKSRRTFRDKFVKAWEWLTDGKGHPVEDAATVNVMSMKRTNNPQRVLEGIYDIHTRRKGPGEPDTVLYKRIYDYKMLQRDQSIGVDLSERDRAFMNEFRKKLDVIEKAPVDYLAPEKNEGFRIALMGKRNGMSRLDRMKRGAKE